VGVEVLGVDDPDLDVEVIALAWASFAAIGLRQVRLLVNSLGEHEDRDRYNEAVRDHFLARRSELSEASLATLERNPLRLLDSKRPEDADAVAAAIKFWQLNRGIRRQLGRPRSSTAAFRQRLERIWQLDPAASDDSTSRP
jgi:histidyl-tRNA synthetase